MFFFSFFRHMCTSCEVSKGPTPNFHPFHADLFAQNCMILKGSGKRPFPVSATTPGNLQGEVPKTKQDNCPKGVVQLGICRSSFFWPCLFCSLVFPQFFLCCCSYLMASSICIWLGIFQLFGTTFFRRNMFLTNPACNIPAESWRFAGVRNTFGVSCSDVRSTTTRAESWEYPGLCLHIWQESRHLMFCVYHPF